MDTVDDIGYGRQFASFYDRIFPKDSGAELTADVLTALHPGDGASALELGVGTGRIAVPLSQRTGTVVGVDSSTEMLDRLRFDIVDTSADVVPVLADLRSYCDEALYGLVYCVCGTLSMLVESEQQQRAVNAAAARLAPGGVLVVETHNPPGVLTMLDGRQQTSFFVPYAEPNTGLLTYSALHSDHRTWQVSHVWFEGGASFVGTEVSRLTTPEEVDEYAMNAGLRPVRRWSDWRGAPYAVDSPMFISVYMRSE